MTAHPPESMSAPKARWPIGCVPNAKHQPTNSVFALTDYSLAIVEFDDQGRCYDRGQMESLANKFAALNGSDAVILVFVHGWKHDGRSDDDNLRRFQEVAQRITAEEKAKGVTTGREAYAASGFTVYQINESGIALQATVGGTKYWKDSELNQ